METTKHYSKLKEGMVNYVVPTNFQMQITAVKWASQDKTGLVTLGYIDDTKQSKKSDKDIILEMDSFLNIISFVQN